MQDDRWVDKHISELTPNDEWQPSVSRALARLRERKIRAGQKRNWALIGAAVAAACLCLIALPSSRAAGRRLWSDLFSGNAPVVRTAATAVNSTQEGGADPAREQIPQPMPAPAPSSARAETGARARLDSQEPAARIENITSDIVANAADTRSAMDGAGMVLVELLGGQGASGPQAAPSQTAPPPYDPFELVTIRPASVTSPEGRSGMINLVGQALQKRAFFDPVLLPPLLTPLEPGVPYTVKVSFTAGGRAQDVGPGEMEETRNAAGTRRWTGHVGGFSLTRIIADRSYDSGSRGPLPMRLEMVREIVFGNLGGTPPNYTTDSIRTAHATLRGVPLTCILISPKNSAVPIRDWSEREYCVDLQSATLRVYSAAPGIYVVFGYGRSSDFHGHSVPDRFTVTQAGKVVLQGAISVRDPEPQSLAPALFTPTHQMASGDTVMVWPIHHVQPRVEPATANLLQPVIVHATLSPDGSVIEAEALQMADPRLSQSAIDLVRRTKYDSAVDFGFPRQQEIFVTVQ